MNPDYSKKYIKYKYKYLDLKVISYQQNGGAKLKSKSNNKDYVLIKYPAASSFWDWCRTQFKMHDINMKEIDTGGDYYQMIIGDAFIAKLVMTDWKHLDISEIETVSDNIKPYGYKIDTKESPDGYAVKLISVPKK